MSKLRTSDLYESAAAFLDSDSERAMRLAEACLNSYVICKNGHPPIYDEDVRIDAIYNLIGSCYTKADPVRLALPATAMFRDAAYIDPTQPLYRSNMALGYMFMGEPYLAQIESQKVVEKWPDNEEGIVKLANAYMHQGRHEDANRLWAGFADKNPTPFNAMALGLSDLLLSDIGGEMNEYKFMGGVGGFGKRHSIMGLKLSGYKKPAWMLENTDGAMQVVLEQGLGDCVMMIPYLQFLASQVKKLEIISRDHDAAIDIYSSGLFFPPSVSLYKKDQLGEKLAGDTPRCWLFDLLSLGVPDVVCSDIAPMGDPFGKIGLCWRGNPTHPNDPFRSIRFEKMKPFIQEFGSRLFNLQSNLKPEEVTFMKSAGVEIDGKITGYSELSRSILNLSSVVTVDTFISHMAGLLGVPCYTMLPVNVDWRWGLTNSRTPWYSNHRLVRQTKCQDWAPVIEEISNELRS